MRNIRFKYDKYTSGTRVSFILEDGAMSLDIGPWRMRNGHRPNSPRHCMEYPADVHNLSVLKAIVEALLKQEKDRL